jgi:hypothetical protein
VKRFVSLTITILVFAVGVWAQTGPNTTSFRKASTAGLLEDDLDLLIGYNGFLDPARIPLVEGKRLYTSLANVVDQNEEVFSGLDNGYYLIGGSTKLSFGSVGAFYDRLGKSTPLALDAAGFTGMFGHGEKDSIIFSGPRSQIRDETKLTADANRDSVSSQILFGLGRYLGETKRVGIAFYHTDGSLEIKTWGTPASPFGNFTYNYVRTNLDSNRVEQTTNWTGTEKGGSKFNQNSIGLSGWMPYSEKLNLGLQLMTGLLSSSPKEDAKYDRTTTTYGTIVTTVQNGTRKLTFNDAGLHFDGELSGIFKWSDATSTRGDFFFGMSNLKNKSGDQFDQMTRSGGVAADTSTNFITSTYNLAYSGTKDNTTRFGFFTSTQAKLSDRVTFAMGVGVNSSNRDRKLPNTLTTTYVDSHDHTYRTDTTDYTATVTETRTGEVDTTYKTFTFLFPVGLEFHLTDPLVFRLGADHRIVNGEVKTTDQLTSWTNPVLTRWVYEGGRATRVDTTWATGPYTSKTSKATTKTSHTYYTYGAGWNYSERLQLDFMGFADLQDLYAWKLSATLKF